MELQFFGNLTHPWTRVGQIINSLSTPNGWFKNFNTNKRIHARRLVPLRDPSIWGLGFWICWRITPAWLCTLQWREAMPGPGQKRGPDLKFIGASTRRRILWLQRRFLFGYVILIQTVGSSTYVFRPSKALRCFKAMAAIIGFWLWHLHQSLTHQSCWLSLPHASWSHRNSGDVANKHEESSPTNMANNAPNWIVCPQKGPNMTIPYQPNLFGPQTCFVEYQIFFWLFWPHTSTDWTSRLTPDLPSLPSLCGPAAMSEFSARSEKRRRVQTLLPVFQELEAGYDWMIVRGWNPGSVWF